MAKNVTWSKSGHRYTGQIDGSPPLPSFLIGIEVSYEGRSGLMNEEVEPASVYVPASYKQYAPWSDFIAPTAECESHSSYECLNTYDRAAFTFGFLQYGAHVPNGDFVQWFRKLLTLPDKTDWFPDLVLSGGRVAKDTAQGAILLESDESTQLLMDFFNPSPDVIDTDEVVNAAKLIGWQKINPAVNDLQVWVGLTLFQKYMQLYARKYNLDGKPDTVCAVVSDIRHQGRGTSSEIMAALAKPAGQQLDASLAIGADKYNDRCTTLRREIDSRVASGVFGRKVYSLAGNTFS